MTNRSSYSFQSLVDTGISWIRDEGLDMYLLIRSMTSGGNGIRIGFDMVFTCLQRAFQFFQRIFFINKLYASSVFES